jgi:hypothetical protein
VIYPDPRALDLVVKLYPIVLGVVAKSNSIIFFHHASLITVSLL